MKQMSSKQPLSVYWLWERLLSECLSTVGENRLLRPQRRPGNCLRRASMGRRFNPRSRLAWLRRRAEINRLAMVPPANPGAIT